MRILVLGGTAWLGAEIVRTALRRAHDVTALARGESGSVPDGARVVIADRDAPDGYAAVAGRSWDGVIDVSRQPGQARSALAALGRSTGRWVFVSSSSVYANNSRPGEDESAELLDAFDGDIADAEHYGPGKVACEQAVLEAVGPDRCALARVGLIGGPGDHTGRTGYWPRRFARPSTPDGAVLVPDSSVSTQVIDVRDLCEWLVTAVEDDVAGAINLVGDPMPLTDHLRVARRVAGHSGPIVEVSPEWLAEQGVAPWGGPRSLPLWLPLPGHAGFADRSNRAAAAAGLALRPLAETLADGLAWELAHPGERTAGLSDEQERELIGAARGG